MNSSLRLTSLHVLVTRPNGLAKPLCDAIEQHGGKATHFPVIEITSPENKVSLRQAIKTINNYDIAIFISPTAVAQAAHVMDLSNITLKIAAIGSATIAALEKENLIIHLKPDGHNTESLLKHPQLKSQLINDKRIIILKGEGGRTLLADTLTTRGAEIFNVDLYRRIQPTNYSILTKTTLQNFDIALISSGEGLNNLVKMTDDKNALFKLNIIVPGNRCATIAKKIGFKFITTTDNATNASFINTLLTSKPTTNN